MPEFQSQVSQFIGGHGSVSAAAVMEGWLEQVARLNLTPKALKQEFARFVAEVQVYAALEKIKQDRGEHNVTFVVNYAVTKDGVYHLEFKDGRYQLGKKLEDLFRGSLTTEMKAQIEIANKIARGDVHGGAVFSAREAQGGNGSAYDEIFDWRRGGSIDGFEVITMTGSIISNKTEALLEWAKRGGDGISFTFSSKSQPKIGEATFSDALIEELIQKQTKANLDNPKLNFNRLGDAVNNLLETKNLISELKHGDDNPYTLDKLTEAQRAILENKSDQFRVNMQNRRIEPSSAITELRRALDAQPVPALRGLETPVTSSGIPLVPPRSLSAPESTAVDMIGTYPLEPKVFPFRNTEMPNFSDKTDLDKHNRDMPREVRVESSNPGHRESLLRESRIDPVREISPKVYQVKSEVPQMSPFRVVDYWKNTGSNVQSVRSEIPSNWRDPRVPYRSAQSRLDLITLNLLFSRSSALSSKALQHTQLVRESAKIRLGSSAVRIDSPRTSAHRRSDQTARIVRRDSLLTKQTRALNSRLVRSVTRVVPLSVPLIGRLFDRPNFYVLAASLKNLIKANPITIKAREILKQVLELKGVIKLLSIFKLDSIKSLHLTQKKLLNLRRNFEPVERKIFARSVHDIRILLKRINLLSGRELKFDQILRSPLVRRVLERMLEMLRSSRKLEAFKRIKEEIKIALPGKGNLLLRRELMLMLKQLAKKGVIEELLASDDDWLLSLLERRSQLNKRDMRARKREAREKLKKFMDKRREVKARHSAELKIATGSKRASKVKIQKPIDQESRLVLVTEQSFLTDGKNAV